MQNILYSAESLHQTLKLRNTGSITIFQFHTLHNPAYFYHTTSNIIVLAAVFVNEHNIYVDISPARIDSS